MKKHKQNIILILMILALIILPFTVCNTKNFKGTDDKASSEIKDIDKNYKPWFKGFEILKSEELKSTFFAIQAAIGAGILCYYIGFSRGKRSNINKS